ncbi:PAS domain-containing sensor histidine kinase [Flavitalea sp.]|nr:PAS domain S-box protein [Flavitalea sp.]
MPKTPATPTRKSASIDVPLPSTANDALHHLAFDHSLQANLISIVSNGNILIANSACCELLGYTMKELLSKSRADIFDVSEISFTRMIKEQTAEGSSSAEGTAFKKNQESFRCMITSAVFLDDDGIEKSITTIVDQSQQILKQEYIDAVKAETVEHDIQLAISKQFKIDRTQKIKTKRHLLMVQTKQKSLDIKKAKSIARDIKIALKKSALLVEENNDWIKEIARNSYDVMWDWNIATGLMYVGDSIEEVFGYRVRANTIRYKDCLNLLMPDERAAIEQKIQLAIDGISENWNDSFKIKRYDGSIANITTRASIIRNEKGKALHLIGSIQDTSSLWELKNQIQVQVDKENIVELQHAKEINLKDLQIANAMADARDEERSSIGQELHDNINQLLGASKLYLDIAKNGGKDAEIYITKSSEYTLMAINEIRNLSRSLVTDTIKNMGLKDAINQIVNDTMETNNFVIKCSTSSFVEYGSDSKFQLNIFRIIQEQLNNIIKHAKASLVKVTLSQNKTDILLKVEDNGIGFDTYKASEGIGLNNMMRRAAAYNGKLDLNSHPGKGCTISVKFPITCEKKPTLLPHFS